MKSPSFTGGPGLALVSRSLPTSQPVSDAAYHPAWNLILTSTEVEAAVGSGIYALQVGEALNGLQHLLWLANSTAIVTAVLAPPIALMSDIQYVLYMFSRMEHHSDNLFIVSLHSAVENGFSYSA